MIFKTNSICITLEDVHLDWLNWYFVILILISSLL